MDVILSLVMNFLNGALGTVRRSIGMFCPSPNATGCRVHVESQPSIGRRWTKQTAAHDHVQILISTEVREHILRSVNEVDGEGIEAILAQLAARV